MKMELSHNFIDKLKLVIFFIFVLNALDGIFTILVVSTGNAVEANPLMAYLINCHPALFMFCKQLLVYLGSLILLRFRENMLAVFAIFGIFLVYYVNLLYHLRFINVGFIWSLIS